MMFKQNTVVTLGALLAASAAAGPVAVEYGDTFVGPAGPETPSIDENETASFSLRATNQNVINQGLYYLDWLMDHRAEFQLSQRGIARR